MNTKVSSRKLFKVLSTYLEPEEIVKVNQSYLLAKKAHQGQYRRSGDDYISHPLSVALILANINLDHESIIAAILHDTIEDTNTLKTHIEEEFGSNVAHIVDGVSKIDNLESKNINFKQAENFRKLLFAASRDFRVLIIKLADRLHNMRTIDFMSEQKRLIIAKETEEIYIPIARRMGLSTITRELKVLCFKTIYPFRYRILNTKINQKYNKYASILGRTIKVLKNKLNELGIEFKIKGRQKDLVSIYNKMKTKNLRFNEIFDLYALRIIVKDIDSCYKVLGLVHGTYKPIPGKFKDYIALPKDNGYQSLHTLIFAEKKQLFEVQIRSHEMHVVAKYGLAAHWYYKNSKSDKINPIWLKNLSFNTKGDDFIESTRGELLKSDVFIFTPHGDIVRLPHKSSALDFAYSVHTDIGNFAFSAVIDNVKKPLNTRIKSGQTVQIITNKKAKLDLKRLDIARTTKAKYGIKSFFKANFKNELVSIGKKILTDILYYQGIYIEKIDFNQYLEEFGISSQDELFIKIGLKDILLSRVINTLNKKNYKQTDSIAKSTQKINPQLAPCCGPLPGDNFIGVISQNKGFMVHREGCSVASQHKNTYKIDWIFDSNTIFKTKIKCEISNTKGILASITKAIADYGFNISDCYIKEIGQKSFLNLAIDVKSKNELQQLINRLEKIEYISSIVRA